MNGCIGKFQKTDHFLYKQWDRQIHDKLLKVILNKINPNNHKTLYIVSK